MVGKPPAFLSTLSLRRATCAGRPRSGWKDISIHALLAESALRAWRGSSPRPYFYPRSPCGERLRSILTTSRRPHFYPRSPCGERPSYSQHVTRPSGYFYPRSPCGERPLAKVRHCEGYVFLSTLSLRRATHEALHGRRFLPISIHALLAESDWDITDTVERMIDFYPRSPCGERLKTPPQGNRSRIFLSTLSLRRATPK